MSTGYDAREVAEEMAVNGWPTAQSTLRNAALLEAEHARTQETHEAHVEYSETVAKLREQFEHELAEAGARLRAAVRPAHQAYNAAVIAAELMVLAETVHS